MNKNIRYFVSTFEYTYSHFKEPLPCSLTYLIHHTTCLLNVYIKWFSVRPFVVLRQGKAYAGLSQISTEIYTERRSEGRKAEFYSTRLERFLLFSCALVRRCVRGTWIQARRCVLVYTNLHHLTSMSVMPLFHLRVFVISLILFIAKKKNVMNGTHCRHFFFSLGACSILISRLLSFQQPFSRAHAAFGDKS